MKAADFAHAIEISADWTASEWPGDAGMRARSFIAYLAGALGAMGAKSSHHVLVALLKDDPKPSTAAKAPGGQPTTATPATPAAMAPTADEQLGMNWWNNLTEDRRAHWLAVANSAAPYAAWLAFRRAEDDLAAES